MFSQNVRKHFPFIPFPEKADNLVFKKKSKKPVFLPFLMIAGYFCQKGIFPKHPAQTCISSYGPQHHGKFHKKLVCQLNENFQDGQKDRPYSQNPSSLDWESKKKKKKKDQWSGSRVTRFWSQNDQTTPNKIFLRKPLI